MERFEHWTSHSVRLLMTGLWLVLLALCLRLAASTAVGTGPITFGGVFAVIAECLTPQQVREETASEKFPKLEKPPRAVQIREPAQLNFTVEEADAIAIGGTAESIVDPASLLLAPLKIERTSGPLVLIVHTHTTEAYTPEEGATYTPSDPSRTLDPNYNMIRVGQEVAAQLQAQGIGVIHDQTVNDDPEYLGAYERSFDCIERQLAEHPSIRVILDLHRDAAENDEGTALRKYVELDGKACAQLMLVVGTNEGGLAHPNWQENLSFALKLQALLERRSPGICRNLSLRTERFNQHFTPCSLLVEVGASGNTLSEALYSADYLAQALTELIEAEG